MNKNKILMATLLIFSLVACNSNNNSNNSTTTSSTIESSSSIVLNEEKFDTIRLNEIYNNIAMYVKNVKNNNSAATMSKTHSKKNKFVESNEYSTLGSIVALIKLSANMYMNPNFIVSDEIVIFDCLGYKMAYYNEINVENNQIAASIIFPYGMESSELLINISVDYDFTSETINGFLIRQTAWTESYCNLHYKYEDNVFYTYTPIHDLENETEEGKLIQEETNSIRVSLREKEASAITIDVDFTKEYEDAMSFAFGE